MFSPFIASVYYLGFAVLIQLYLPFFTVMPTMAHFFKAFCDGVGGANIIFNTLHTIIKIVIIFITFLNTISIDITHFTTTSKRINNIFKNLITLLESIVAIINNITLIINTIKKVVRVIKK